MDDFDDFGADTGGDDFEFNFDGGDAGEGGDFDFGEVDLDVQASVASVPEDPVKAADEAVTETAPTAADGEGEDASEAPTAPADEPVDEPVDEPSDVPVETTKEEPEEEAAAEEAADAVDAGGQDESGRAEDADAAGDGEATEAAEAEAEAEAEAGDEAASPTSPEEEDNDNDSNNNSNSNNEAEEVVDDAVVEERAAEVVDVEEEAGTEARGNDDVDGTAEVDEASEPAEDAAADGMEEGVASVEDEGASDEQGEVGHVASTEAEVQEEEEEGEEGDNNDSDEATEMVATGATEGTIPDGASQDNSAADDARAALQNAGESLSDEAEEMMMTSRPEVEYDANAVPDEFTVDEEGEIVEGIPEGMEITQCHTIRIHCSTWNMNGQDPKSEMPRASYLPYVQDNSVGLYVVALQEAGSYAGSMNPLVQYKWEENMALAFGPEYEMVAARGLAHVRMLICARSDVLSFISNVESDAVNVGVGNVLANKGAVAISMRIAGRSFCFISCHLNAHQERVEQRNKDYSRISKGLKLPSACFTSTAPPTDTSPDGDAVSSELAASMRVERSVDHEHLLRKKSTAKHVEDRFDYVFWVGDLNYRVNGGTRAMVERLLRNGMREVLISNDQLLEQIAKKKAFIGFKEGPLEFPPTYKFDAGTSDYDTSSKQRIPSWTDRILWKDNLTQPSEQKDRLDGSAANGLRRSLSRTGTKMRLGRRKSSVSSGTLVGVTLERYDCVRNMLQSDHWPVYGVFQAAVSDTRQPSDEPFEPGKPVAKSCTTF